MATKTQAKVVVDSEYRKISVGQTGAFVNRSLKDVQMLEASAKPDVSEEGDPMVSKKRYSYSLKSGISVWAKAMTGKASIGVTGNDS